MSKQDKMRTDQLATAMNVLKGAVQQVLHTPVTAHIQYDSKTKGRLAVVYDKPTEPTAAELKKIQQVVNGIIVQDVPITVTKMARKEAEATYGTGIYDQIKPPEDLQELNILHIPDWNTNAVKDGAFLASTGGLNAIAVQRHNFRPQKTHVEFCFEIVPAEDKRSSALRDEIITSASKPTESKPVVVEKAKQKVKTIPTYSEELVDFFFSQLEKNGNSEESKQKLRRILLEECNITLTTIQNTSFAAGFKAAK